MYKSCINLGIVFISNILMKGITVEFKIHQMNQNSNKNKQHKYLSLRMYVVMYYLYTDTEDQ